ncbi:MAG TPA: apolipoprotein N-acyltransferase [Terriglobales bacterium]|nr:apolipoprotein N-acyltransferase [Terriglobales bacterium]
MTGSLRTLVCYASDVRRIHSSAWLLVGLSAVLQVVIFPLADLYWVAWLAVTPLLVALLRARPAGILQVDAAAKLAPASPLQGFVLAYVCGILWNAGTCYWVFDTMHRYGGLSSAAAAFVLLLFCLYIGLYHGLFGLLLAVVARRALLVRALVAAPFIWVAVELARTRVTAFPWELLGYAQTSNIAVSRIATLTGVYGISFEIVLVNSVFAAAFLVEKSRRNRLLGAAFGAALVLQVGQWTMKPPPAAADRAAVLVQPNIPIEANWTENYFQSTLKDLAGLSLQPPVTNAEAGAAAGEKVIVWPESPAPFFTNDMRFRDPVSELARQSGNWVIVGAIGVTPANQSGRQSSLIFNSAALVSPQGEWTGRYDKVHLVPFGEYLPFPQIFAFAGGLTKEVGEFQHGTSRKPLDAGRERIGTFICYESIFPDEVRRFALDGAGVLVNISNDGWYGDSGAWKQHLQQTRMRAIENDRWLLSATNTGLTAAIDPWGRVVADVPRKERTAMVAPYALVSGTTFYTQHGDWFAYLCAIISVVVSCWSLVVRKISRTQANG